MVHLGNLRIDFSSSLFVKFNKRLFDSLLSNFCCD